MMLKFIRFRGDIIQLNHIEDVIYMKQSNTTKITYKNDNFYKISGGDYRDDIWALMQLALKPKPKIDFSSFPEPIGGCCKLEFQQMFGKDIEWAKPNIQFEDPTGIR